MPIPLTFKAKLDDSALMAGFRRIKTAGSKLGRGFGGGAGRAGRGIGGFAGGVGGLTGLTALGSAAGLGIGTKKLIDQADAFDRLSIKTGITVEQLAKLQGMSQRTDISMDSLSNGVVRMQKNLFNGSEATEKALSNMGLSIEELRGLSPDEQFLRIGKAVNEMGDQSKKASSALALFGKQGTDFFELFRDMESIDAGRIDKNAKSIADAVTILAPLADKIDEAKFALLANTMKGLGKGVKGVQGLMGWQPEEPLPPVTVTGKAFRDTLGFGRKKQGLEAGGISGGSGIGSLGTSEGIGVRGGVHSVVRRGDAGRERAAKAEVELLKTQIEAKEYLKALKESVEEMME